MKKGLFIKKQDRYSYLCKSTTKPSNFPDMSLYRENINQMIQKIGEDRAKVLLHRFQELAEIQPSDDINDDETIKKMHWLSFSIYPNDEKIRSNYRMLSTDELKQIVRKYICGNLPEDQVTLVQGSKRKNNLFETLLENSLSNLGSAISTIMTKFKESYKSTVIQLDDIQESRQNDYTAEIEKINQFSITHILKVRLILDDLMTLCQKKRNNQF